VVFPLQFKFLFLQKVRHSPGVSMSLQQLSLPSERAAGLISFLVMSEKVLLVGQFWRNSMNLCGERQSSPCM